ncbi:hypothetical protein [Nocardioides sp.]|uniref:hypothetical protein n=1 Tax=Nocardioides sp. TaxID=35761 RepID=UPI003D0CB77B
MRRLLVALLLALSGVVLGQLPAHACSCVVQTPVDQMKHANDVFVGTVTSKARVAAGVTYVVAVERVYKGSVSNPAKVTTGADSASCGVDNLVADRRYVFMGAASGDAIEINLCGGTAPATTRKLDQVTALFGAGKAPAAAPDPDPVSATITRVDDTKPVSFARLAAPGGALLIVGLLGLFLLRRMSRAR